MQVEKKNNKLICTFSSEELLTDYDVDVTLPLDEWVDAIRKQISDIIGDCLDEYGMSAEDISPSLTITDARVMSPNDDDEIIIELYLHDKQKTDVTNALLEALGKILGITFENSENSEVVIDEEIEDYDDYDEEFLEDYDEYEDNYDYDEDYEDYDEEFLEDYDEYEDNYDYDEDYEDYDEGEIVCTVDDKTVYGNSPYIEESTVYGFESLKDTAVFAKNFKDAKVESMLFKKDNRYLLSASKYTDEMDMFASEYLATKDEVSYNILAEHGQCVIKDNALEKLGQL